MSNKAIARRAFEDFYANRKPETAGQVYSPDFVDHDPATPEEMRRGPKGVKQQAPHARQRDGERRRGTDRLLANRARDESASNALNRR